MVVGCREEEGRGRSWLFACLGVCTLHMQKRTKAGRGRMEREERAGEGGIVDRLKLSGITGREASKGP